MVLWRFSARPCCWRRKCTPRVLMEILGHSRISIMTNLYGHVVPAMQQEVAAWLDAILAPPAPSTGQPRE